MGSGEFAMDSCERDDFRRRIMLFKGGRTFNCPASGFDRHRRRIYNRITPRGAAEVAVEVLSPSDRACRSSSRCRGNSDGSRNAPLESDGRDLATAARIVLRKVSSPFARSNRPGPDRPMASSPSNRRKTMSSLSPKKGRGSRFAAERRASPMSFAGLCSARTAFALSTSDLAPTGPCTWPISVRTWTKPGCQRTRTFAEKIAIPFSCGPTRRGLISGGSSRGPRRPRPSLTNTGGTIGESCISSSSARSTPRASSSGSCAICCKRGASTRS